MSALSLHVESNNSVMYCTIHVGFPGICRYIVHNSNLISILQGCCQNLWKGTLQQPLIAHIGNSKGGKRMLHHQVTSVSSGLNTKLIFHTKHICSLNLFISYNYVYVRCNFQVQGKTGIVHLYLLHPRWGFVPYIIA